MAHHRRVEVDHVVDRRSGDDAVEVVWVSLRRHQPLPSSRRAPVVVRQARRAIVERGDESLGSDRHLVHRAIGKVDDLFRMADQERGVLALVAGVIRRGCVALLQCHRHLIETDRARPAAIADGLELPVPRVHRQPQLHLDARVGRRCEDGGDSAVRRQRGWRRAQWRLATAAGIGSSWHERRGREGHARKRVRFQGLARRSGERSREQQRNSHHRFRSSPAVWLRGPYRATNHTALRQLGACSRVAVCCFIVCSFAADTHRSTPAAHRASTVHPERDRRYARSCRDTGGQPLCGFGEFRRLIPKAEKP